MSRSPFGKGAMRNKRPDFFNRTAGKTFDNFSRTVLVETVYLRNYEK
jgi:hypothetical protein